jgi:hypothetical protein
MRSWVCRLIFYPLILHTFGLIHIWHKYPETDATLREYTNEFEELTGRNINKIHISIQDKYPWRMPWMPKDSQFIGLCTPLVLSTLSSEIVLWKNFWSTASEIERKLLIYHELGHCECHRFHDNTILPDGCAKSIMNEFLSVGFCAQLHYSDYIVDLQEKCK